MFASSNHMCYVIFLFTWEFPPLKTATAVDWHLKAKDIEYDVGLTKSYCITISMTTPTQKSLT